MHKRGPKSRKVTTEGKLPFAGGDFWANLVTAEPKSASEILNATIAALEITPSE